MRSQTKSPPLDPPEGTRILTVFLLLVAVAIPSAAQAAEDLAREGRRMIEINCGDCYQASRAGLEEGIGKLTEALELGLDEPAAYRELAEAWSSLALVYAEPDSAEQQDIFGQRRQAWESYLKLVPDDTEALYEYAFSLDGDERISALERLLVVDPEHPEALFAIGQYQVENERVDEGLDKMRRVFEKAAGEQAVYYGRRLRWALNAQGRQTEEEEIALKLRKLEDALKPREDGA